MKINLFFLRDKILSYGAMIVRREDIDSIRKDLLSGMFIIRQYKDEEDVFYVSVNRCFEDKAREEIEKGPKGIRSRLYKLFSVRELVVVDKIMDRLQETEQSSSSSFNHVKWYDILKKGVYFENTDNVHDTMLDVLVYTGKLDFETYHTYSIGNDFIDKLLNKGKIFLSVVKRHLEHDDDQAIDSFMSRLGYERKGKQYIQMSLDDPINDYFI